MNSGFYHCPDCDGDGDVCVMPCNNRHPDAYKTCPRCEGRGTIPEEDLEFLETARPWTPSKRRWHGGPPGWTLAMQKDPLEQLRSVRNRYGRRGGYYVIAHRCAIESLSHTRDGLALADQRAAEARSLPCAA